MQLAELIPELHRIVRHAGALIRTSYQDGEFESMIKADDTPVTSVDLAVHAFLKQSLNELTPSIPVLSEEEADIPLAERQHWQRYWLVDPLDGTQEFIARSGDFATVVALVEAHKPILGIIFAPISDSLYWAVHGEGAFKQVNGVTESLAVRKHPGPEETPLRIAVSRVQKTQQIQQLISPNIVCELLPLGSSALKSCFVAEGSADCYIRLGPTGEWDTGAAQCILEEAGGRIFTLALTPLSYNQRESLINPDFISLGDPTLDWQQILMTEVT